VPRRLPTEELDRRRNAERRREPFEPLSGEGDFRIDQMAVVVADESGWHWVAAEGPLRQTRLYWCRGAELRRTGTA
jgi:hypothetical protein